MSDNLFLRGKTYSIRLFIPVDLQKSVGRKVLVKSLKTCNKTNAKILLRRVQHLVERLYFYARIGMVDRGKLTQVLQEYIENCLTGWPEFLKNVSDDLSETVMGGQYLTGYESSTSEQYRIIAEETRKDYFMRNEKDYIRAIAKRTLKRSDIELEEGPEFDKFCDQFVQVHMIACQEMAKRLEGRYDYRSYSYRDFVAGMIEEQRPILFKQAVEELLEQKRVKGLTAGSLEMYEINSGIALKFYGEDYPVKRLNNRELLRFVQHEQGRGVKNVTIIKRIRLIKAIMALAGANHGFAPHTYKVELSDDTADVIPYTPGELNQLFTIISSRRILYWQYWAVLVGLFGGLRREEVVSLRMRDIKNEADKWYFDIKDSKSDAGIRYTPISSILKQLGFLAFVEERRKSGDEYLFMCRLRAPKSIYAPVPVTKYGDFFANLRESKMNVELEEGEKKTLHSLRHNYSDALKQAGVRPDFIDELCGHEHAPGSMRSIYDEKYGIAILAENLEKAVWGCDFSLLKTWKPAD